MVVTDRARVLVDCGMFQGADADRRNQLPRDLHPDQIDAVVLTHAHLDHSGRLPLLLRGGYRGPIYATPASIEIARLLLADAAQLQAGDAERANRKRQRAGQPPVAPLFGQADVAAVLGLTRPLPYEQPATIAPGVEIRMVEAGHILGSASVVMQIADRGAHRALVFSGDLGPRGAPILNDPARISQADLVVLESTYGDRDHRPLADTLKELAELLLYAGLHRSKVLIPAFAIGRTQELLYHLAALFRDGLVPPMPVYLDSPLAIKATELYLAYPELADPESRRLSRQGRLWRGLATLRPCVTVEESRALNQIDGPCIIIAGSGMCTGGRILHHLRHQLWRPETLLIFAGYQAEGTLGRQIVEGARRVQVFGEPIAVRAQIHTLGGLSAHAGQSELLEWLAPMAGERPRVILTHGEERSRAPLARCIAARFGISAELPALGDVVVEP
ncbi:MAG TPA: MBL fold metallo-hydrolase [Roseiflexaceae bacterium]|nr:MBL fold metallo-hydrolase [Roseiflexaceae bacterium]